MLTLDDNGYPTEETLGLIERWPHTDGFEKLMDEVRALWRYADAGYWRMDGLVIHASTGGWSGNEDIIGSLQNNFVFWAMHWEQSRRGGHYIFNLKP